MNSCGEAYGVTCGGLSGLVPSCTDEELDKGKGQHRLDASSYTCSICFELLLDPVVGAYKAWSSCLTTPRQAHSLLCRSVLLHAAHVAYRAVTPFNCQRLAGARCIHFPEPVGPSALLVLCRQLWP
jgi:hypothetical protein